MNRDTYATDNDIKKAREELKEIKNKIDTLDQHNILMVGMPVNLLRFYNIMFYQLKEMKRKINIIKKSK